MTELEKRLAGLSHERRRAFERLLAQRSGSDTVVAIKPTAGAPRSIEPIGALTGQKANTKRFYDLVNEQLNPTEFGPFSLFLNYGYVSDDSPEFAAVSLPEHYINRNSVKLVLEVIGDAPLAGETVLDVGCGRGGTVWVLEKFFNPARVAAIDISSSGIQFCVATHRFPNVSFLEADAERLPFCSDHFGAVTNIESSHLYPDLLSFYREVFRVLRPGGRFLYSDLQKAGAMDRYSMWLGEIGFIIERQRDITNNVLPSCEQIASQRVSAYGNTADVNAIREFVAAPGSQMHEDFRQRTWTYTVVRARKP